MRRINLVPIKEAYMKKGMYITAIVSVLLSVLCFVLYRYQVDAHALLPLSITFGTIAYHFWMRLGVGAAVGAVMKNKAVLTKARYQCGPRERKIYEKLKFRRWKNKLPTFRPDYFDRRKHSWEEIAHVMCQAETVHEIIVALSFVPVIFSIWLGALPVFIVTSVLAACFDLLFVMAQRFNRDRVVRVMRRGN